MPSWNELLDELMRQPPDQATEWLRSRQVAALQDVSSRRGGRNVLFYASAFLQKPQAPGWLLSISPEDLNAFMSVMHGMDWDAGLTLLLHTPGGRTDATETLVSYLRSKFQRIEVIVPTFAMSAGTMVALSAERMVLGRQSQLGPIDPQFISGNRTLSAGAILAQWRMARTEIIGNPAVAQAWFPVLQTIGPSLIQEAQNALAYGEQMVADWLETCMFAGDPDATQKAERVAAHFNDTGLHLAHGRRIDRAEARAQDVVVEDMEDDQDLQEAVLTAYHLATIGFEKSPAVKVLLRNTDRMFVKNWGTPPGAPGQP
jgi:hypothetical protein